MAPCEHYSTVQAAAWLCR